MPNKIRLYNTLSRKKEIFKPIKAGHVGIYSCGPTVYWYQHIGNLRSYVNWDLLKRFFIAEEYEVKHIINVTDVGHLTSDSDTGEDKIEKAARQQKRSAKEVASYYFKTFKEDLKKINVIMPEAWPRATEHITYQIELIKKLEKKGYTYKTEDGIYFDTSKFKDYGKFAKIKIKNLEAGKRVSLGLNEKRSKTDFALWKFSKEKGKRQQEWDSPWGVGFPGWHIECSAMSMKYLGETFDIHTGGGEHIQIHHQNEIAQSEAATGKTFVNYWLHGAWLMFKGDKVSKSKGGLYRLSDLEEKGYSPMDLRYFFLSANYRKQLNFSFENLDYAKNSLKRLKGRISQLDKNGKKNKKNIEMAHNQFLSFLEDDLNVTRALSYTWEILRDVKLKDVEKYELVLKFDEIFGLNLGKEEGVNLTEQVKDLIKEREKARNKKDFVTADKIRGKINKLGFVVEDKERGFLVKKK